MEKIVNKVAKSQLITFDLEDYYHSGERVVYDIKQNLYQGLVLKEAEFRAFVKEHSWSSYQDQNVAIICSVDAIVPTWAFMLIAIKLEPFVNRVVLGDIELLEKILFQDVISQIDFQKFEGKKIVIKGCSNKEVPQFAYIEIARLMRQYAFSIMYGEPCSTVPLFKKNIR